MGARPEIKASGCRYGSVTSTPFTHAVSNRASMSPSRLTTWNGTSANSTSATRRARLPHQLRVRREVTMLSSFVDKSLDGVGRPGDHVAVSREVVGAAREQYKPRTRDCRRQQTPFIGANSKIILTVNHKRGNL